MQNPYKMKQDNIPFATPVPAQTMLRDSDKFPNISRIKVEQKFESWETWCQMCCCNCCEWPNQYKITDQYSSDKVHYIANEKSNVCCRVCCHPCHPATLNFRRPESKNTSFSIYKPFKCQYCFNCIPLLCAADMRVIDSNGNEVARAREKTCSFTPKIILSSKDYGEFAVAKGDTSSCCFGGITGLGDSNEFLIIDNVSKRILGKVRKTPTGPREVFSDADSYEVNFEQISDQQKQSILASSLLLDYLFLENDQSDMTSFFLGTCYCFGCGIPCRFDCNNKN
jgi:hypothetical protein